MAQLGTRFLTIRFTSMRLLTWLIKKTRFLTIRILRHRTLLDNGPIVETCVKCPGGAPSHSDVLVDLFGQLRAPCPCSPHFATAQARKPLASIVLPGQATLAKLVAVAIRLTLLGMAVASPFNELQGHGRLSLPFPFALVLSLANAGVRCSPLCNCYGTCVGQAHTAWHGLEQTNYLLLLHDFRRLRVKRSGTCGTRLNSCTRGVPEFTKELLCLRQAVDPRMVSENQVEARSNRNARELRSTAQLRRSPQD